MSVNRLAARSVELPSVQSARPRRVCRRNQVVANWHRVDLVPANLPGLFQRDGNLEG